MVEKDKLAPILSFVFQEDRKQLIIPPKNVEKLLEKMKELLYIDEERN